jgi:hypothetical protein
VVIIAGSRRVASEAAPVPQCGPASTTLADTAYRADGTTAEGNLIIPRPAFETASGTAVAASTTSVTLGGERHTERGAGTKCGRYCGEYVPHRAVPAWDRRGKNGALGSADELAGELAAVRTTPASGIASSRFRCSM